ARAHGGRVAMIGILPTLRPEDLRRSVITDSHRYRALNHGIQRLRQEPFRVEISGPDGEELAVQHDDVVLEGANTSFQVHLRVAMRALPAGPTIVDMLANAAFHVGVTLALAPGAAEWTTTMPFARANANFYQAARDGLAAKLEWPAWPEQPRRVGAAE